MVKRVASYLAATSSDNTVALQLRGLEPPLLLVPFDLFWGIIPSLAYYDEYAG